MEQNYWGKDPSGKFSKLGDFFLCISGLAIVAGIIFLCSAQKPSSRSYLSSKYDEYLEEYSAYESKLQTGWTMVGGGISLLLVGLGIGFVGDCVEYRNDLIKQEITVLQEVRKDIQSLKAKESSSDDQSNPETVQTESSDNLDNL